MDLLDMKPCAVPVTPLAQQQGSVSPEGYRPRSPRSKASPAPPKVKRSMVVQAGMEAVKP